MNCKLLVVLIALVVGLLFATPETADATLLCKIRVSQPMMEHILSVVDPCTGCAQDVCVCIPCCCTEEPAVTCRTGIFGRTILTHCWECCGHSVDIIINRCGEVRVR